MFSTRTSSVLVTGGAGFIGGYLVGELLASGLDVCVLDDFSAPGTPPLPKHPRLRVRRGSTLDPDAVSAACRGAGFVFHLAGIVGMQRVTAYPELTYHTSVTGTLNVLRSSGNVPIVVFSSSAVYGLTFADSGTCEEDASLQRALAYDGNRRGYAAGKWQLERIAECAREKGRPVMLIRPFNVVGCGQSLEAGMIIPRLVHQALAGEPLTIYGDGTQERCFTEVSVFVRSVLRLAGSSVAWAADNHCFNIGTRISTSILELARIVTEETNSHSPMRHYPYDSVFPRKTDVRQRVPDDRQLNAALGGVEWPPVRTIVRQYVAAAESERLVAVGAY